MADNWESYDRAFALTFFIKILFPCLLIIATLGYIGYLAGWFSEAAKVTQDEFGPKALLAKYSWFKDSAAQLEKKQADISVYQNRMTQMNADYKDVQRSKWAREDREQYNVWSSEVAGIKASYNSLAAEYNSAMSKFHWKFANVGELPPGANQPLPREFKPYIGE